MLRAVQYVEVGTGRKRAPRVVFRILDVEQIGYVYEGLLSYEGFRADDVVVGLIGKQGLEEEVRSPRLEQAARRRCADVPALAADDCRRVQGLEDRLGAALVQEARAAGGRRTRGGAEEAAGRDTRATTRWPSGCCPSTGCCAPTCVALPVVILPGALYVTESALRGNTGTHYTPRELAEEVVLHALEPLVFAPGPLQTADRAQWTPVVERADPGAEGRRHRDGFGRVPRRRRPLPR